MIIHFYKNRKFKESFDVSKLYEDDEGFSFTSLKFPPPSVISTFKTDDDKWIKIKEVGYEDTKEGRLFSFRADYL